MQAGTYGEALRRVADRLCAELADPEAVELPEIGSTLRAEGAMTIGLDAEDEALVADLRKALAAVASTLSAGAETPAVQQIKAALDGAEFVMRSELAAGNPRRILKLIPSFVFLVALSAADQDRALELSFRAAELIEKA
ncbi:MAG TPA: hypothetical protein VMH33_14030 [Solirubrobacterales bacterium]|nr:hypothetical protein [Solirubrobacterales bacterium]